MGGVACGFAFSLSLDGTFRFLVRLLSGLHVFSSHPLVLPCSSMIHHVSLKNVLWLMEVGSEAAAAWFTSSGIPPPSSRSELPRSYSSHFQEDRQAGYEVTAKSGLCAGQARQDSAAFCSFLGY